MTDEQYQMQDRANRMQTSWHLLDPEHRRDTLELFTPMPEGMGEVEQRVACETAAAVDAAGIIKAVDGIALGLAMVARVWNARHGDDWTPDKRAELMNRGTDAIESCGSNDAAEILMILSGAYLELTCRLEDAQPKAAEGALTASLGPAS